MNCLGFRWSEPIRIRTIPYESILRALRPACAMRVVGRVRACSDDAATTRGAAGLPAKKMDVTKFISLVYANRCLWDQNDATYLLRDHQFKAWRQIAEEIGTPIPDLKRKWRGLRDTFVKELRKLKSNQGDPETDVKPESKWAYFKNLLFLYNTINRKDLKGLDIEFVPGQGEQVPERAKRKRRRRSSSNEFDKNLLEMEHEKFRLYQQNVNDPDAQFLMSLLPFLKDVPRHRKLHVRTKLHEVLINEESAFASGADLEEQDDSSASGSSDS
ncbi:unnamed protein product [Chrysodeixis includens]|uniref:MADF domain-containing protein n=1 Tax=Chrysodeixis includens TaxID=689277 RepID=A0A9P0FQX5_CHRIL|nr:unnamed protein product [Chrysodeixis includens]